MEWMKKFGLDHGEPGVRQQAPDSSNISSSWHWGELRGPRFRRIVAGMIGWRAIFHVVFSLARLDGDAQ
jgi:hypothetical protein